MYSKVSPFSPSVPPVRTVRRSAGGAGAPPEAVLPSGRLPRRAAEGLKACQGRGTERSLFGPSPIFAGQSMYGRSARD